MTVSPRGVVETGIDRLSAQAEAELDVLGMDSTEVLAAIRG